MDLKEIESSTSNFPFKKVKGKRGSKFSQVTKREDGTGTVLDVDHNGHDHITLDFRSLYKKENGKIGNKRIMHWSFDAKVTVQFASLLFYLADEEMKDSDESPFTNIVSSKEKIGFGSNWLNEDFNTAIARIEKRKSRSHVFGLMKRCIETCDDDDFIEFILMNLACWADKSGDQFAIQQSEKAIAQLGLLPKEMIN